MPDHVIAIVKQIVNIDPPNIAVFGIAYKGNVDDYRQSPSLRIIELAEDQGWGVKVYDPVVKKRAIILCLSSRKQCATAIVL